MSGERNFRFAAKEEIQNRPKLIRPFLFRILSYLKPYLFKIILALMIIVVIAVLDVLPATLSGRIIDEGFIQKDFHLLLTLIFLSITIMVISSLLSVFENYLNIWVSQHIVKDMKNEMYMHLQQMSQRFFTTNKQGDIITRMTSDITGAQAVISNTLTSTVSNIAILITSMMAMIQKNWLLSLVGISILPLFILPTKLVGKKRWKLTLNSQIKRDKMNQILDETLSVSGQNLVKVFANEEQEYQRYAKTNEEILKLNIEESMAGRWFRMTIGTFTNMGPMFIYLIGGIVILKMNVTSLTVGDVTVMVTLLTRMYRPVSSLLNIQVDFFRGMALFTRIFEYLDMSIEIQNKPNAKELTSIIEALEFKGVCFGYTQDQQVLNQLSFTVPKKSMTAIVGSSGSGKTTLINLLLRLYDVNEGSIEIDGVDIREINIKSLRKNIGIVTQESYLFNGTIRENLLYAKADATEEELIHVCEEVNIAKLISSLPDGLDTVVGNRGVKLSGG